MKKLYKHTFYFSSQAEAKAYAEKHDYPINRILYFTKGWAIQGGISGDYAGPHGLKIGDWPNAVLKPLKNPAKLERCVRKVKARNRVAKRRGRKIARKPYAVCKSALKRKPRRNPSWYIHAQKAGKGRIYLYSGGALFSNTKPPLPFISKAAALYKARHLLGKYHRSLSRYKVWVADEIMGAASELHRVNPEGLDEAAKKLEDFSGHPATRRLRARVSDDKTGLVIGEMNEIGYVTRRKGIEGGRLVHWRHKFRKGSRPLLTATSDGKQLRIVGGRYEFTEAGIEDR